MGDERIAVGHVSRDGSERPNVANDRTRSDVDAGDAVELPIVDLLTGRGFITGKSGSGKSNTASVVAEKLLDQGYGLLAVDIDGEYYGLKEEYEVLHVGGDDECDLQVNVEHAEKLATLALEQGVPIILDVSSFLDERDARELLKEVAKHLFAKEKKLKQPFLMLVEECHEFIPESAGMDECGRMLVKVGKRGRKHGLGIVGISQRPADVKKDFITQCDWLVWHRLTWSNDTKVAGRILGSDYRDAVEDLDDGECFLMADWEESIRRVQMERKRTFDAGATPGLDDFERPELKSVSADLMGELQDITERERRRESRVQQLETELSDKEARIEELEAELEEARDLSSMAEQFSRAMMEHASGRPFRTDVTGFEPLPDEASFVPKRADPGGDEPVGHHSIDPASDSGSAPGDGRSVGDDRAASNGHAASNGSAEEPDGDDDPMAFLKATDFGAGRMESRRDALRSDDDAESSPRPGADDPSMEPADADGRDDGGDGTGTDGDPPGGVSPRERPFVRRLREEISTLDEVTRGMLAYYREYGPASPIDAQVVAGGEGERTEAYRRNGILRERDLIEHAGRGGYTTRFRDVVVEAHDDRLDEEQVAAMVDAVAEALPPARPPQSAEEWPDAYDAGAGADD